MNERRDAVRKAGRGYESDVLGLHRVCDGRAFRERDGKVSYGTRVRGSEEGPDGRSDAPRYGFMNATSSGVKGTPAGRSPSTSTHRSYRRTAASAPPGGFADMARLVCAEAATRRPRRTEWWESTPRLLLASTTVHAAARPFIIDPTSRARRGVVPRRRAPELSLGSTSSVSPTFTGLMNNKNMRVRNASHSRQTPSCLSLSYTRTHHPTKTPSIHFPIPCRASQL